MLHKVGRSRFRFANLTPMPQHNQSKSTLPAGGEIRWTPRQREVLALLVRGRTNGQIADELRITLNGAKWHVSEVITKLGVESREEAAEYWRARNAVRHRIGRTLHALIPAAAWLKVAAAGSMVAIAGATGVVVLVALQQAGTGDASVAPASTPSAGVTANPAAWTIDSGAGWRYVLDSVSVADSVAQVQYHVEGNTTGLFGLLPRDKGDPNEAIVIPANGAISANVLVKLQPGATSFDLHFGTAVRSVDDPVEITFAASDIGGQGHLVEIAGQRVPARIFIQNGYTSVAITSNMLLNGPGARYGSGPTLRDNLGNDYPEYHGSATATVSEWDFSGALSPSAASVTFRISGYAVTEGTPEVLTIPIP
jgi:DNA-binding CsgD family transcriptional regulator